MECHFPYFERCFFLESNEEKGHQPYVCISDHFVDAVKSGHLQVRPRVVEVGGIQLPGDGRFVT